MMESVNLRYLHRELGPTLIVQDFSSFFPRFLMIFQTHIKQKTKNCFQCKFPKPENRNSLGLLVNPNRLTDPHQITDYNPREKNNTCWCWRWSGYPICRVIHTQIWRAVWSSGFNGTWFVGAPTFGSHHGSIWSIGYAVLVVLHHRGRGRSKRCK